MSKKTGIVGTGNMGGGMAKRLLDLGWPEFKVAGELDGWGKYERIAQFREQARRDSYLQIRGWIVVHFTWHEVTRGPRRVISELQAALRSRGWVPTP
ncbi:MAG: DUF559 domain-containing protein [Betaproteobacteria bacterium]|nr:DUF559 domain-containing protein [Betaproteobacteria bacterium]